MKLTAKDWREIRTKYEMGIGVRELERQYNYDSGNISKRAKKEGWTLGLIQQDTAKKTEAIQSLIDADTAIAEKIPHSQVSVVNEIIISDIKLKNKAKSLQDELMDTIRLATKAGQQLIDNSKDGRYIKSEGAKGVTYGSVTEIIPHMSQGISSVNAIIKDDKPTVVVNPQTNTQVNINTEQDPAQVYEEMIKS